jgi:hypothetical protein
MGLSRVIHNKKAAKSPISCCFCFTTTFSSLIIELTGEGLEHFYMVLFDSCEGEKTNGMFSKLLTTGARRLDG